MASQSDGSGGLDWDFGSFLLQGAFAKLGQGLRWMFWGSMLQVVGGGGLIAGFGLALHGLTGLGLKACLFGSGAMLLIGSIILLLGEQRSLHLELPLGMTHALPGPPLAARSLWLSLSRNSVALHQAVDRTRASKLDHSSTIDVGIRVAAAVLASNCRRDFARRSPSAD